MNHENCEIELFDAQDQDFLPIKCLLESVKLPIDGVKEHLTNFVVFRKGNSIIGAIGLEIYDDKALLRSLGVANEYQGKGLGSRLSQAILKKAKAEKISEVYLLTETAEHFFAKQGFQKVSREAVDTRVKESVEFRFACPESAVCMRRKLI